MIGCNEDESALRDAVLLTVAGDDPGPAGKLFLATQMLMRRSGTIGTLVHPSHGFRHGPQASGGGIFRPSGAGAP